ncbi:hypothetical protein OTU49_001811 [Cherax quadricarinatus]|uniref:Uncharacterized protein n=1 Tax=Cherax quadricarinatus TaxID=27406 RepID=A0AAW0XRA6_CHEQU
MSLSKHTPSIAVLSKVRIHRYHNSSDPQKATSAVSVLEMPFINLGYDKPSGLKIDVIANPPSLKHQAMDLYFITSDKMCYMLDTLDYICLVSFLISSLSA